MFDTSIVNVIFGYVVDVVVGVVVDIFHVWCDLLLALV